MSPKPLPGAPNNDPSPSPSRHASISQVRPVSRSASRHGNYTTHMAQDRPVSRSTSRQDDYVSQVAQQRSLTRRGESLKQTTYQQPTVRSNSRQGEYPCQAANAGSPVRSPSRQADHQQQISRERSVPAHQHSQPERENGDLKQSSFSGFWSVDRSRVSSQQHSRSNSISKRPLNAPGQSLQPNVPVSQVSQHQDPVAATPKFVDARRPNAGSSNQVRQPDGTLKSPQIARAISARRVSPQMRVNSAERIQVVQTQDPKASSLGRRPSAKGGDAQRRSEHAPMIRELEEAETKPLIPQRTASRKAAEKPSPIKDDASPQYPSQNDDNDDRSDTDLPIQNPPTPKARTPPPTKVPPPPGHARQNSGKHMTMVSQSDYSNSPTSPTLRFGTPVSREGSPAIRNVPGHSTYNSVSFLPMHPALSPLADPRGSFGEPFTQQALMSRPSTAPRLTTAPTSLSTVTALSTSTPIHRRPSVTKVPSSMSNAPDDSEGSVNVAHPLLQAERHSRFATIRTTLGTPRIREDVSLRHYRSQEAIRRPTPDSEEKEVFVPPKRSSSLGRATTHSALSASLQAFSPVSAPTITTRPPTEGSQNPVAQTEPIANANLAPNSPQSSVSTLPSAAGATPPAISRTRSPIPVSNSTPDLPTDLQRASVMSADLPHPGRKIPSGGPRVTPSYLNPVSSAALVDFLATTPPSTPPNGTKPPQPLIKPDRTFSPFPNKKPLNVFPSTKPLHINGTSICDGPRAIPILNPIGSEKRGWRRIFGNKVGGNPKISAPMLLMGNASVNEIASPKQKKNSKSKQGGKMGDATPDGGFMGVGKDGVWISRKNFLKT